MKFTELLRTTSLLKLIAALSSIAVIAIIITIVLLYNLALEQHGRLLTENVGNQVALMRAMQQLGEETEGGENIASSLILNAISQMQQVNRQADETGSSSEFTVAKREGEQIIFLLLRTPRDHGHSHDNFSVPFASELAEPMQRALSGETGMLTGLDHHGEQVLAAYQYMPEYGLGIVAKIGIAELLMPYLLVILLASTIAIIFVFIGAYIFSISVKPFYVKREKTEKRLQKQHEIMSQLVERKDINACDMPMIFEEITEAASKGMAVSRVSIWIFDDDHSHMHCADLYDGNSDSHVCCDVLAVDACPNYFSAVATQCAIRVNNVYSDKRTAELIDGYMKPNNITALLDMPIMLNGMCIGVLCNEQTGTEKHWLIEDENFARSMADQVAMAMNNCQRNKAEHALKESEERYQLAVSGSSDGLWDWDMSSNKVYRSPQYKKMLDYENDEFSDDYDTWLTHLHPEDRKPAIAVLDAHLENIDIPYDVEYRLRTKSGKYRWFRARGGALRDENGKPYRVSGSITDITDLKRTQHDLSRFKQTLDGTSDNILMFDPETLKFFYANKSACESIGYTEEELLQLSPVNITIEFNEKNFREMLSGLISNPEQSLNFETIHLHKNGEQLPVEVHLQYIAPANTPPRFVAIVHDVSKRKNAEVENYIQRTMLEHIHQIQDDFISGVDSHVVSEKLLNGFLDITESEYGFIGEVLYDADEQPYLRIQHITDIAWNDETRKLYENRKGKGLEFHNLDNLLGAVIRSGKTVISNNTSDDHRSGGLPDGHPPLNRFMGIPLKCGKTLIGMIGIANCDSEYNEDLLTKLQPLLSTCVNLIEARRTDLLRNSMENALRSSEEKVSTVLATIADGIITINDRGIIESFNPAAEKIFGYTAKEAIGNNVNMLMPEPDHSAHDGYLEHYHQTGEAHIIGASREVDGKRKDGTVFPLELAVSEMQSDEKRRYTGMVRDISARKQAEIALIAARDEAEQANRTKSEFLSNMSHELRTPLNAIMGFAQLLQLDKQLSGPHKKHAREIYGAGTHLLELINDVLDLTKIEVGHIDLSIESVKLEHILKECFKLIKSQADKNGIKLAYETSPSNSNTCKDIWVRADNIRFKQVLLNLLSNAVKYNRENGAVYVCCSPTTAGFHRIRITDNGYGISKEDMENLFQPFNRLGAERGGIEGTGIGLVITRKLIELMGGSISVESEPNKGTSFLIDLPASEALAPVSTVAAKQPKLKNAKNHDEVRILIAEDNLTNQELITLQLHTLGYKSDVVANGKEAIEMLYKHHYALLLTDIHMPEVDGYQLTGAVRDMENSHIREIPIIAITANAAAAEAAHCLEQGMNDYLSKPVDINDLQNKLNQWLPGSGKKAINEIIHDKQKHVKPSGIVTLKTEAISPIDTDTLARYIGNDPDKHRHFFKLFTETAPEAIFAIHNAHKKHSCSDVRNTCHKLKSSARAIGAIHLSTLCQQIEAATVNEDWKIIDEAMPEVDTAMSEVETYIHALLKEKKEEQQVKFNFDEVMVIDDDRFVLDLVTSRLNNIGIENVITASSAKKALSYIKKSVTPPSVLLLDLNMPGMDGVEFLRHLSERSYQGDIILISGEDARLLRSTEIIARDRDLNILGVLEKPITIPALTELLLLVGTEQTSRHRRNKILLTEDELRSSIENDELVVYYQPQIDIASKQLSSAEALVRWAHPERGMIPPDAFIPAAEKLGLINEMTDIIMNKAMKQCVSWCEQGLDINLSVNLSVDSLNRLDLPEYIVSCAEEHQLDVSKIILEITESRLMEDITSALDILTRLNLKGIRLSIDDFGTGYSSMEKLKHVPFTELKIDRSFVSGALHDKASKAIIESSVELAQKLNMTIVAEGVENEEEWNLVAGLGITYVQGYFVSKPIPGEKMISWYEEWKSRN